jgi:hypothetical protein
VRALHARGLVDWRSPQLTLSVCAKHAPYGLVAALVLALVPLAGAQSGEPSKEDPQRPKTVRIVLHPQAEARAALKYRLLPPVSERRPGNAAVLWNRIPAEQTQFFTQFHAKDGQGEKIERWLEVPLGDPREKELRKEANPLGAGVIFQDMDRAARFEHCDWQLPIRDEPFLSIRLPELQQTRVYGRLLAAKARAEVAEGRFDDAVRTFQTAYSLARHVAEGPTLINGLVGIAIASITSKRVEEFIQQPGAPNLYWALSSLPRPLISIRRGIETEMEVLYFSCPELRDLDRKDRSPEYWRRTLANLFRTVAQWGDGGPSDQSSAAAAALALNGYPQAKKGLIERGRSPEEVEAMPVPQVILLYAIQTYEELRDEQSKWIFVPYPKAREGLQRFEKKLRDEGRRREVMPLASLLLPAISSVKFAEVRGEREIAVLQVLEALRLYAASHGGRLPEKLADITEVPVPENPMLGEPFVYHGGGEAAVLEVLSPPGYEPRSYSFRYEIRMVPQGKP